MYGLRKQGVEAEEALLTVIPNYQLREIVLLFPQLWAYRIGGLGP